MRGVAAVAGVAGEERVITKVFTPAQAKLTMAASAAQPRNADTSTDGKTGHAATDHVDAADDLVTGDDRQFGIGQVAVDDMKVRAAHAAGANFDADFAIRGLGVRPFNQTKRFPRPFQHHRSHWRSRSELCRQVRRRRRPKPASEAAAPLGASLHNICSYGILPSTWINGRAGASRRSKKRQSVRLCLA
jgi:hypothetical protein